MPQEAPPHGPVNGIVHPTTAGKRMVCGIDDGIHLHFCNVLSDQVKRYYSSSFQEPNFLNVQFHAHGTVVTAHDLSENKAVLYPFEQTL